MEPERESPYWDEIVGDNWPVISPGEWHGLERLARDGASALDTLDVERRRRAFDDRVRAGAGLQPVKDDMLRQRANPQAFADALEAAADAFRDFSDLAYRTRNQILDIVDAATSRIAATQRAAAAEEDEAQARAVRARIPGIVEAAARDVDDVVRTALRSINPVDLPSLSRIADALGQPGPWLPRGPGGSEDHARHRDATDHSGSSRHGGPPGSREPGRNQPGPGFPRPLFPDLLGEQPPPGTADPSATDSETRELPNLSDAQSYSSVPSGSDTTPSAPNTPTAPVGYTPTAGVPDDAAGVPSAGPLRTPEAAEPSDGNRNPLPGTESSETRIDPVESAAHDRATSESEPDAMGRAELAQRATAFAPDSPPPPPVVLPGPIAPVWLSGLAGAPSGAVPGPAVSAPAASSASAASAPAGSAPAPAVSASAPAAHARQTSPPVDARAGTFSKVGAVTAQPPPGKAAPPRSGQQPPDGAAVGDDPLRDVVGAAMTSAAAPAFVLGERVDGDLVLARTLLSNLLAVDGTSVIGLGWAVSVMRDQSGVSAFVTSNEGRGWLPAGLYLPREVSTPWVWEVCDGFAWEGVADPARVLAEFAAAWGRRVGARLSAIASSLPIDAELRRQSGEVSMAGEVRAAAGTEFGAARHGSADRLGLVGAPELAQRIAATPEAEIGARCRDLAFDAHTRLSGSGLGSPDSLGTPGLRARILTALAQGRDVRAEWWDDLRDADDLLAASLSTRRLDVSRIPLGELRSDRPDGRSAPELGALRALVFERRCDELVLLLSGEPTRQVLRDATYAHAQVAGHPAGPPPVGSGPAPSRRPTITTGPGR